MTITKVQLRDFARDNQSLGCVRRPDWSGTPFDDRQAVRYGLGDVKQVIIEEFATWELTGPVDPDNPPANDDQMFVWNSIDMGERLNLFVQAVITDQAVLLTVVPQWNFETGELSNLSAYRADVTGTYGTAVDDEMDARHPEEV